MAEQPKAAYIDSHVHLWELARGDYGWLTPAAGSIYRDFTFEQLAPHLDAHAVQGIVAVQAAPTVAEAEYLLKLTDEHPRIVGVIGWMSLIAPDFRATFDRLAEHPAFAGIRLDSSFRDLFVEGSRKEELLDGLRYIAGKGKVVEWLMAPGMIDVLLACLPEVDGLKAVVDHLGNPPMAEEALEPWSSQMEAVSRYPHTAVKLSGMITQGDRTRPDRHRPFVERLNELFGPSRLLFGSDWPVALLGGSYDETVQYFERLLPAGWDEATLEQVRRTNAIRIYGLSL
ncbi:MAG: amidohydrolase family protein [Paenibacillaceae bacterium]|nr:amidohydrolase family protein [Paenibacillaceae bacterium]